MHLDTQDVSNRASSSRRIFWRSRRVERQGLHTPSDVGNASLVSVYQMLRMTVAAVTRRYANFTERKWNRGLKTKNTMGDGREGSEEPREKPGWGLIVKTRT